MSVTRIKARQDQPRDAIPGDHVYYRHPEHGPCHGEVTAVGKHGFRCRSGRPDGAEDQVRWEDMLGHKARKQRRFVLVDRGEDGALAEDDTGAMQYIRGDVADPRPEPLVKAHADLAESVQVSVLELARAQVEQAALMGAAIERLTKALGDQSGQLSALIGALGAPKL